MDQSTQQCIARRNRAASELEAIEPELDANRVTQSLVDGFDTLSTLMFQRIHDDVEAYVGRDSMLIPVSLEQSARLARREIEAIQLVIAATYACERGYVRSDVDWFLPWITRLRMGKPIDQTRWRRRTQTYVQQTDDERRLGFSRHLESVFPEARHAPLILYRLYPLSIRIVTAVAFGSHLDAVELRNRQAFWLPEISDCHECHGRPLDNDEQCDICGNPVWSYQWLTAQ